MATTEETLAPRLSSGGESRALAKQWRGLTRADGGAPMDDLVCHELCHVWQMQHHPLRVFRAWLTEEYERNPYELQARRAVEETKMPA